MVKEKGNFIITTNVNSQFEKSGFSNEKVFEVQGNYGYLQCAKGCHDKVYYNESLVREMVDETDDCKIPSELVPKCPVCDGNMDPHLRINQYFVQNDRWYELNQPYNQFLQETKERNLYF